jgi:hypothetical protein
VLDQILENALEPATDITIHWWGMVGVPKLVTDLTRPQPMRDQKA